MTSALDAFDYKRIDIDGSRPLSAYTWKHFALVRFEQLHVDAGPSIDLFLEAYKKTELWCGLQSSPHGYTYIICAPGWPSIDKGAEGLSLIDQFFPRILTMTGEDWNDPRARERLVGILRHTDAIPILTAVEVLCEYATGKITDGEPLSPSKHPYKGP